RSAIARADPDRTVGDAKGGNAQLRNPRDVTPAVAAGWHLRNGSGSAMELLDLLVERHRGDEQRGALRRAEAWIQPRQALGGAHRCRKEDAGDADRRGWRRRSCQHLAVHSLLQRGRWPSIRATSRGWMLLGTSPSPQSEDRRLAVGPVPI